MIITVAIDGDLLRKAQRISGAQEDSAVVHKALKAMIERESARRLTRLGGSEPQLRRIARRRPDPAL